jgi:soluble lytic murein transglycosylase-like protein
MRVGWWLVAAVLAVCTRVEADIYLYRDRLGVLHLTNAPTGPSVVVMKERPAPKALRSGLPVHSLADVRLPGGRTAYDPLIREIADRFDVEYALVKAVIRAESGFDHRAISPKGALGLMQLMPATAALHGVRDAFYPRDNLEGGVRHLRMLLDRYGGNLSLALAAYNAGAGRVENAGGVPAIPETREYVERVLRYRIAYLREGAGVLEVRR